MIYIVDELGNIGEHRFAINLDQKVLREDLRCKRLCIIANILYDDLWNEEKQKIKLEEHMDAEKMTEGLKRCVMLSHFCKQTYYEKFYDKKLHQS